MISITEIVLIVAGFAAIILGYLLPAGKEMDEEDKMLMEREIRELVRREVDQQRDTIEDMVGDSVENSLDRTERAMERISNEKMSAIGEYSDTVINDIHKNHDEVMFMYDMLNDKHISHSPDGAHWASEDSLPHICEQRPAVHGGENEEQPRPYEEETHQGL